MKCRSRAVLSDQKRRELYDAGMYDPLDDSQEEVEVIELASPNELLVLLYTLTTGVNLTRSLRVALSGFP